MERKPITDKQFKIFMIAAFGLAWIFEIVASLCFDETDQLFTVLLMIAMYMPFLGAIIARIPFRGMGWIPHLKGKIRYIFIALWVPALLSIIGGVLFFLVFPNAFDSGFTTIYTQLKHSGQLEKLEAKGITVTAYVLLACVQSVTYAPFINMFVALGEEVGWRGVLYVYLKDKMGVTKGRILGGTLWGCWHWPLIILAGYEYGEKYIGSPVLGPVVFCLCSIAMGILLDYIYEKTGTIWMPALMHGAVNAFTIFAFIIKPECENLMILGPAYIGIISMIPLMAVAVIICIKQRKKDKKTA